MSNEKALKYAKLMDRARKVNAKRDADEAAVGFLAASKDTPLGIIRTAMAAIRCGVLTDDWDAICEGQVLLETLLERFHVLQVDIRDIDDGAGIKQ